MDYKYYLGKTLGKCLITDLIGVGGMGWVYLATHTELSVPRAIKILKPVDDAMEESRRKLLVERFVREARIAASLNHKNIIKIHDVGAFEGTRYIEMEFLKGVSLRRFVADFNGSVPEDIAAALIYLCADALAYAHRAVILFDGQEIRGVIHRDLKPENIFITAQGEVKVLDFGIAKLLDVSLTSSTEARNVTGTIAYMSPEQLDGARVGPASDVFSMGTVFYEMLTGKNPFLADPMAATVKNICLSRYPPLSGIRPGLHPAFSGIIRNCLRHAPSERFRSAADIREAAFHILSPHGIYDAELAVREFITTGKVTLRDVGRGSPAPGARGRLLAASALLLCAAGAAFIVFRPRTVPDSRPPAAGEPAPQEVKKQPAAAEPQAAVPAPPVPAKTGPRKAAVEAVPAKHDTVAKGPDYEDSIRIYMGAGNHERALDLMLPRLSRAYAVNYAASFPDGDQAHYLMQGLNAFHEDNFKMAVSYFDTSLRRPTRFSGLRHRLIENALYYKALSYSALAKNGLPGGKDGAIKSWEGLKKMTSDPALIEKADRSLKELNP